MLASFYIYNVRQRVDEGITPLLSITASAICIYLTRQILILNDATYILLALSLSISFISISFSPVPFLCYNYAVFDLKYCNRHTRWEQRKICQQHKSTQANQWSSEKKERFGKTNKQRRRGGGYVNPTIIYINSNNVKWFSSFFLPHYCLYFLLLLFHL